MNKQPVTKPLSNKNPNILHVNEIFESIQGEGPWSGEPVLFIRLAGCNLQCVWCDTEYSSFVSYPIHAIIARARVLNRNKIVITGGEPFLQDISKLVRLLLRFDFQVQIETNGTLTLPNFPFADVLLVCSPKAGRLQLDILKYCKHYKYVVDAQDVDSERGLPCTPTQHNAIRSPPRHIPAEDITTWIMPLDDEDGENQTIATKICMDHGHRLSLRLHKILGVR